MRLRMERGNQRINIGDRVKVYERNGDLKYGGRIGIVIEKAKLSPNLLYYALYVNGVTDVKKDDKGEIVGDTAYLAPFFAEDLELVNPDKDVKGGEETATKSGEETMQVKIGADFDDTYWTYYRAELAKELSIKVMNGNNIKDTQVSDYVVDNATKIVKNLKKTEEAFVAMLERSTTERGLK